MVRLPEKSGFFDHTEDDPREYPAREFAEYFGTLITNGVLNSGLNLNVSATGTDANVSISTGIAWINGYRYSIYDSPLVLPIQPATTQDRIDRIVLRLDTSIAVKRIRALVVQGTPSANPAAPSVVRSGDVFDLSLAQVRVKANTTLVLPANITDERLNQSVCGLMNSLIKVDTATFQQQWDAFIASVQNQGFATPSYVDNKVSLGDYGTTTNVGNAYSVTTASGKPNTLSGFVRVTIKVNAANTGASTLNVNGLGAKEIRKGNGNPVYANNLKAGSIYTLVYDGSSAFILQGEGGEYGTAIAGDVRATKTIGTDSGLVAGTLTTRATAPLNITPGTTDVIRQAGIYDGDIIIKGDVDLIPSNIRNGKDVFGVVGNLTPSMYQRVESNFSEYHSISGTSGTPVVSFRGVIDIPGGTSNISIAPSDTISFRSGDSENSVRFAIMDDNGLYWFLSNSAFTTASTISAVQIDIRAGVARVLKDGVWSRWNAPIAEPTNFNKNSSIFKIGFYFEARATSSALLSYIAWTISS